MPKLPSVIPGAASSGAEWLPGKKPEPDDSSHERRALVRKNTFSLPEYTTVGGKLIKDVQIGWEAYGRPNAAKDNIILIPHFFSGNSHAAGKYNATDDAPGYWYSIIGPGKPIDTNKFYVISVDALVNLNSKDGITVTTGPSSIDPDTGKPYGLTFPVVTIRDFVRVQKALLDSLGISKLHAVGGVSMGSLQSYEWAAAYPEMVDRVFAVDGTISQTPYTIIALESWVAPIRADQNWNGGNYYGKTEPVEGVMLASFNVWVTALHDECISETFGYNWADLGKSPLDALGNDFLSTQFGRQIGGFRTAATDANHMLYMARANQLFVAGTTGSSVDAEFKNIKAPTLVIHARTDLLFPPEGAKAQVARLQANGTQAEYFELDSSSGHYGGISDVARAGDKLKAFLSGAD